MSTSWQSRVHDCDVYTWIMSVGDGTAYLLWWLLC